WTRSGWNRKRLPFGTGSKTSDFASLRRDQRVTSAFSVALFVAMSSDQNKAGQSPRITHVSWGRMDVEKLGTGRDFKLYPGGGRACRVRKISSPTKIPPSAADTAAATPPDGHRPPLQAKRVDARRSRYDLGSKEGRQER